MHIELACQLRKCPLAAHCGKSHLRLELCRVVTAGSSAHLSLLSPRALSCPQSGSDSTYPPVQISGATSNFDASGPAAAQGRIAFSSFRDGNTEIYVVNADGSGQTNLTNHGADDRGPAWSPDGAKIAFWSDRAGNTEIYVMNADGSGQTN